MKTLPQIAIDCTRIEPSDGKGPYQLLDDEGEVIAELPAWVPYEHAPEAFRMVLGYEARGRRIGENSGAREEREKIVYGFRAVFAPLTDAFESVESTVNERLSSRD